MTFVVDFVKGNTLPYMLDMVTIFDIIDA